MRWCDWLAFSLTSVQRASSWMAQPLWRHAASEAGLHQVLLGRSRLSGAPPVPHAVVVPGFAMDHLGCCTLVLQAARQMAQLETPDFSLFCQLQQSAKGCRALQ